MRLSDLAKGSSVFLGVIVAGYVSTVYVDQRLAPPPKTATESSVKKLVEAVIGRWQQR